MKRKGIMLRLPQEQWEEFKQKAVARGMPLTVWVLQACRAYEAKGARWGKKQVKPWGKCYLCGKKHDPKDHGELE